MAGFESQKLANPLKSASFQRSLVSAILGGRRTTPMAKSRPEANVGIGCCVPPQPPILAMSAQATRKGRFSHFGAYFAEIGCCACGI
jgi:hypothetical protein